MRRGAIVLTLAFLTSLAVAPSAALAGRLHGGPVGGGVIVGGRPFASHPFVHHRFFPRPFFPRPFFGPFIPFGVIASPVVVYASPPVVYGPPGYYDSSAYYNSSVRYDPPAIYSPPARGAVSVAPALTPTPNVIQYPTGRYELRGDGVATPYTWVWIPNPPPPPPAAPPGEAPTSRDRSPARHNQPYHWTDEQGVVHWTDRWDTVPQQYREQARQTQQS